MALGIKISALAGALLLPCLFVSAASALTVACTGTPAPSAITWSAQASNGVQPYSFLWGNGSTSTSQTVNATPGQHSMNLQVTDASSTVATTTCSATVAQGPSITSFTASPTTIIAGQSSVLSWAVVNASSTSINQGVGTVSSTSATVSPSVTTIYTLTATSPIGSVTKTATVSVVASSTPSTALEQIKALLAQIEGLKKQIALILVGQVPNGGTTATSTPMGCFGYWRDLKRGDEGDDVRELQRDLAKSDPTLFPPGLVNGFFGPKTFAALKVFQKRFGIDLAGTGYFGMKSRGHFSALCSNGDADKDGIPNVSDSDDDNDGTPDVSDRTPLGDKSKGKSDDDDKKNKGENKGKGNGHSDDDDDDEDEDEDD